MRTLVLCIALAFLPKFALAHSLSASYLSVSADRDVRQLEGRWEVRIADLNDALDLDTDADGSVTWGELEGESVRSNDYVLSRLTIAREQQACALFGERQLLDQRGDGYYLVLRFNGKCPAGDGALSVESRLLFERDASQRVLVKFAVGRTTRSTVLKPEAPRWQVPLQAGSAFQTVASFVREGIHHIWVGYDHLAFLILLLLPAVLTVRTGDDSWRPAARWQPVATGVLRIVTAFTLAHSITLSLAALGIVVPPERPVEAGIAASVAVAGVVNLFPRLAHHGTLLAFTFGLLHGFGFANALRELDLASTSLAWPLAGFNLGVEIGQLTIVLLLLPFIYTARQSPLYLRRIVPATSIVVAVLAGGWLMQRLS